LIYTELHYQTALSLLFGVGPIRGKELIQKLESLEQLFFDEPKSLSESTDYREDFFRVMDRQGALDTAEEIIRFNEKNQVRSLYFDDKDFPYRLNNCSDGPIMLYVKGQCDLNNSRFVALVGTRDSTSYGQEVCHQIVESFQGQGITTVSGLAYGIDTWAHKYSVDLDVKTIAGLAHGHDRLYPFKNSSIARQILEKGGALISEFPPGTNPDRENFPKRNRIVAGMSDATIVVESKTSGGSLITARLANDYNRDVFAVPGTITKETSKGCNRLIATDEAHLFEGSEAFLRKMGWANSKRKSAPQRSLFPELTAQEKLIIELLRKTGKRPVDHIAIELSQAMSTIQSTLFMLEMKGMIRAVGGNRVELVV
jgi:DNA processing protein